MKKSILKDAVLAMMLLVGCIPFQSQAQNFFQGQTKLTIVGNAQVDYVSDSSQSQFRNLAFKPIFLLSLSDKLFLESELEVSTNGGSVELVLEYANMVYFVNQHLAIHAGRFLPKFGGFRGRFGEAYLMKFATNPVGFGDGGIGPMTETGLGAQGGAQLGSTKINYDFYISNGPQLLTSPDEAGQFEYEAYFNNNKHRAIGGRFGFLPFSNSSLEIGISFLYKKKTGDIHTGYEPTSATFEAVDLNYVKDLEALKSTVRIIGEWKQMIVGKTPDPTGTAFDAFGYKNNASAFYAQASIRPSMVTSEFVRNLELAGRYSEFKTPDLAVWGGGLYKQQAVGLNYWYRWNGVLKLTWQKQYLNSTSTNSFVAQLVYGF